MSLVKNLSGWALVAKDKNPDIPFSFFVGKYCWLDATDDEPAIRVFRTRKLAIEASKTCCYKCRAVKIDVRITAKG